METFIKSEIAILFVIAATVVKVPWSVEVERGVEVGSDNGRRSQDVARGFLLGRLSCGPQSSHFWRGRAGRFFVHEKNSQRGQRVHSANGSV
jgi:hypothetical protein